MTLHNNRGKMSTPSTSSSSNLHLFSGPFVHRFGPTLPPFGSHELVRPGRPVLRAEVGLRPTERETGDLG